MEEFVHTLQGHLALCEKVEDAVKEHGALWRLWESAVRSKSEVEVELTASEHRSGQGSDQRGARPTGNHAAG